MTDCVAKNLARYGISIGFTDDGMPELVGRQGVKCTYSARGFCPVVGLGAPDGAVSIRRRPDGVAELMIAGERFEYRASDPALEMEIPNE
jgi:hypothetical protein